MVAQVLELWIYLFPASSKDDGRIRADVEDAAKIWSQAEIDLQAVHRGKLPDMLSINPLNLRDLSLAAQFNCPPPDDVRTQFFNIPRPGSPDITRSLPVFYIPGPRLQNGGQGCHQFATEQPQPLPRHFIVMTDDSDGRTLAHEIGHALFVRKDDAGEWFNNDPDPNRDTSVPSAAIHNRDPQNLMNPKVDPNPVITAPQIDVAKKSPLVHEKAPAKPIAKPAKPGGDGAFLAWKGADDDGRLFFNSSADGQHFTEQQIIGGTGGTSHGPTLAAFNDRLYVAWKGADDDGRLFFNSSADGQHFTEQQIIGGTGGTSHGPTLAAFNDRLYVAWKGADDDGRLFFNSSADGQHFTEQQIIGGTGGTSHGPTLAAFNDRLYVAWKGADDDGRLFFNSSADGQHFTEQQIIGGTGGTSHGPTLAAFNDRLYVAWKGADDDGRLFFNSSADGQHFTEQQIIGGTGGTSHGPTLAAFNDRLYVAWKGADDDGRLFFNSSADGQHFTEQQIIGGTGGTSHGPTLAAAF